MTGTNLHQSPITENGKNTCDNFCKSLVEGTRISIPYETCRDQITFIKVPIAFEGVNYKDQRLYINYLDLKAQKSEGIFRNHWKKSSDRRHYQRVILSLIQRGWARPALKTEDGNAALRSYPHVWRSLGIPRADLRKSRKFYNKRKGSGTGWVYFKIPIEMLSTERRSLKDQSGKKIAGYVEQINQIIQKKLAERRRAQIRWSLKDRGEKKPTEANFSALSAALLFGYKSPSTGSKLRKKFFSISSPEGKPFFNKVRGRYEEPTKRIAL